MIETRLMEKDPVLGQTKLWHYDHATDEAWIETKWDLDAYGAAGVEAQKENDGKRMGDGMEKIAQIPMALYWKLKNKGIFDDDRAFRRWFQSDEARPFKVRNLWV